MYRIALLTEKKNLKPCAIKPQQILKTLLRNATSAKFQNKKLKRNATSAIAEFVEVALCPPLVPEQFILNNGGLDKAFEYTRV